MAVRNPLEIANKIRTFATAVLFGDKVDPAIMEERMSSCLSCDYARTDRHGYRYCGICGCSVSSEKNRFVNLTAYVERLPDWGCKHPVRKQGYGWKR